MNNNKYERAITMIALIVVIIVSLVLIGVTLGIALPENGIIKRAMDSSKVYMNSTENEEDDLLSLDEEISLSEDSLIKLYKSGEIKTGDYINYRLPNEGSFTTNKFGDEYANGFCTQSFDVNNNGYEIKWRILGLEDADGNLTLDRNKGRRLLIISGSPVQKNIQEESENEYERTPYLYLGKAEGYLNSNRILNEISRIYINPELATSARSIKVEDINTLIRVAIDNNIVYYKNNISTNIDLIRTMGNVYNFSDSSYSAESYANGKTAKQNNEDRIICTNYSYLVDDYMEDEIGKLLFQGTGLQDNCAKSYWLDSNSIGASKYGIFSNGGVYCNTVNLGMASFYSNGNWMVYGLGVRPVISLNQNLTIDDLEITSGSEESWTYINNNCYCGTIEDYEQNGSSKKIFN